VNIKGRIVIRSDNAPELAVRITQSVEPDNLKNITTEYGEDSVTTRFKSDKIGSLIATVDDYLLNARIARDIISAVDANENREDDDRWNSSLE
jgi:hypothetical protein